jgi:hypothetical protein
LHCHRPAGQLPLNGTDEDSACTAFELRRCSAGCHP